MIIIDIDIAISKHDIIISKINDGHVYDLAHACMEQIKGSIQPH
jgi:hypothetical protein